uniref:SWIM-type domain-containing protein n=1 Tax=Lactuca sativa TaxID=4236 RepID=A0A9R1VYW5_LACSA|nr:hypothetical protein LSAT_V11C400216340 [Lactuca sativa]
MKGFHLQSIGNVLGKSVLISRKDLRVRYLGSYFGELLDLQFNKNLSIVDRSCDAYENGVSESFNSVIKYARKKPLITMLEEIHIYAMERLCIYKSKGQSWDVNICPSIRLNLNKLKEQQRFWQVVPFGYMQFEVRVWSDGYVVDLNTRQCGCRAWQIARCPCMHGYVAISSLNRDLKDYMSEWFTTSIGLHQTIATKKRNLPGRPTMKRKRDRVEKEAKGTRHTVSKRGMVLRCTICRERGHNRSTCPQRPNDVPFMFESERDSDFESESDVEANIEVEVASDVVPEMEASIEVPEVDVEANIEVPEVVAKANIEVPEVEANIKVVTTRSSFHYL